MRKVNFQGIASSDPTQRMATIESMVRTIAQASQENDVIDIAAAFTLGAFTPTRTLGAAAALLTSVTSSYALQTFAANGTYTPTTGMVAALMFTLGGGGAGGGVVGAASTSLGGGGGGSGGMSIALKTAVQVGASQSVTIGSGGTGSSGAGGGNGTDTSIDTLCIGKGGTGGNVGNAGGGSGNGGAGGVAGTGAIAIVGTTGGQGNDFGSTTTALPISGFGAGAPLFGGGGRQNSAINTNAGIAATGPGGGGSGATSLNLATNAAGGAGGAGYAFILEFCSASTSDSGSIWAVLATLLSDMKAGGQNRTT